ncbi:MAG TPA: hypothetical protein VJ349_08480 [Stellaceae bacterium]|nr:hypothetical protein [Stellaceae bacterium]
MVIAMDVGTPVWRKMQLYGRTTGENVGCGHTANVRSVRAYSIAMFYRST